METLLFTVVFAVASALAAETPENGELIRKRDGLRQTVRAVKTPSGRIAALHSLGRISQELGAWDEAFSSFERVLRIAPIELLASYEIGRTAVLCGCRTERGGEALMRYLMTTPIGEMPSREDAEELLEALAGR